MVCRTTCFPYEYRNTNLIIVALKTCNLNINKTTNPRRTPHVLACAA